MMRRLAVLTGAATLAAGSVLAFLPSADAATTGIVCSKMSGTITSTVTLAKCTGNTGTKSKPIKSTSLASGGTIKWVNGKTTTVKLSVKQGPGGACPATSKEYIASGKVTADTTKSAKVGGPATAKVCVAASGAITLEPGTKAKLL
jgi:hypothetical protein